MKIHDSGMPEVELWESFFNQELILSKLQLTPDMKDMAEFGCGYGTFTIPAARIVRGTVYALDIEQEMLDITNAYARKENLSNVKCILTDFISIGSGLPDDSVDYAMVFNILHAEKPVDLLKEAYRIVKIGGTLGIIHWNYDSTTPRGPAMHIRPKPDQCRLWAEQAGFTLSIDEIVDLPPYHYGMTLVKN
ncbi:MAG: class I SAM-dependent methyltransferase [Ignavibacterium sp.]|nr:MAG: class I SAM-dependent methyltransferase [Ignavibacterium sp.]